MQLFALLSKALLFNKTKSPQNVFTLQRKRWSKFWIIERLKLILKKAKALGEFQGELHAGQIQTAFFHQVFDLPQAFDVVVAIESKIAGRAGRCDKSLTFVLPKRLRMHLDQPGRNADHKEWF